MLSAHVSHSFAAIMNCLVVCVILSLVLRVRGAPAEDEVKDLPGMKTRPSWKQYSGYLKASGTKHLHYW